MSLSTVLFLFLAHLGVGIVGTLVFVSREAGVKFFRFNAGLAAVLLVIALAFRYATPLDGGGFLDSAGVFALDAATAALVVYWATVGRMWAKIRPALTAVAVGGGILAIVLEALAVTAGRGPVTQTLTVASFLSSAALLGGACTAMILGHWYLVIPSMNVSHLSPS